MEDFVIQPAEYDYYINSIKKFQVDEIGCQKWFDCHEILIKLNQQAVIEATTCREELIKELFVSNDKIGILVHESYCVLIWRSKILPKMILNETRSNSTFIIYSILYHEAIAISLLELILYHENGCQALGDAAVDLIDYCAQAIVQLIGLTQLRCVQETVNVAKDLPKASANQELDGQMKSLQYMIGIRCISILSFFADKFDSMPISVVRRMVVTHDIPCLLSEVLHCKPWIRNINGVEIYIDDKWVSSHDADVIKVTKIEAHAWFCLRQLLFSKEALSFYDINEYRQRELSKCEALLAVHLLDQLPPLVDLKHRLCTLAQYKSSNKSGIILEELAEIRDRIITNAKKIGYTQIAQNHGEQLFSLEGIELVNMAKRLNDAYNMDFFEKFEISKDNQNKEHYCAQCCISAVQKCSNCKQSYYCSRECQVKNWPIHKGICLSK